MRLNEFRIHFIQYLQKTDCNLDLNLLHRHVPLSGGCSSASIPCYNMILEAISDILVNLLHELLAFFVGLVLHSDLYESLDDSAQQIKEVNVIHGEDGRASQSRSGRVRRNLGCIAAEPLRGDVPSEL